MTLLHNPRCSKSRQTLALLEQAGVDVQVRRYLDAPLSRDELGALCAQLGAPVIAWTRSKEAAFREAGLSPDAGDEVLLDAMAKHPILMERPIVISGERALVARPPELVRDLL